MVLQYQSKKYAGIFLFTAFDTGRIGKNEINSESVTNIPKTTMYENLLKLSKKLNWQATPTDQTWPKVIEHSCIIHRWLAFVPTESL